MLRNLGPRAGMGLAALVLSAIFGVSSANAAVTSSHVTVPSSPSFFQENENNTMDPAHQITISGTTTNNGTAGNVDLICTFQNATGTTSDSTIEDNVPVGPSGTFTFSGPVPGFERACVVRAVPAGGGLPADLSPFTGPTVGLGSFDACDAHLRPQHRERLHLRRQRRAADRRRQLSLAGRRRRLRRVPDPARDARPRRRYVLRRRLRLGRQRRPVRPRDRRGPRVRGRHGRRPGLRLRELLGAAVDHLHHESGPDHRQPHGPRVRDAGQVRARPGDLSADGDELHQLRVDRGQVRAHDRPGPGGSPGSLHRHVLEQRRAGPLTRSPLRPGLRQRRRRVQLPLGRRRLVQDPRRWRHDRAAAQRTGNRVRQLRQHESQRGPHVRSGSDHVRAGAERAEVPDQGSQRGERRHAPVRVICPGDPGRRLGDAAHCLLVGLHDRRCPHARGDRGAVVHAAGRDHRVGKLDHHHRRDRVRFGEPQRPGDHISVPVRHLDLVRRLDRRDQRRQRHERDCRLEPR